MIAWVNFKKLSSWKSLMHKNAIKIVWGVKSVALLNKIEVLFGEKNLGAFFGAFWPIWGASWFKHFSHPDCILEEIRESCSCYGQHGTSKPGEKFLLNKIWSSASKAKGREKKHRYYKVYIYHVQSCWWVAVLCCTTK